VSEIQIASITANVGTEGAVKKFPIWDVSEEFPITQSVLNRLTWNLASFARLIHAELVIERNL
jgi:hypothetical protein